MNKKIFLLSIFIFLMFICGLLWISGRFGVSRMTDYYEKQFIASLTEELSLVTATVRNDLLFGNTRSARGYLNSLLSKGVFSEYSIQKGSDIIIASQDFDKCINTITINIPVYFETNGLKWGEIKFKSSRQRFIRLKESIENELIFVISSFAFSILIIFCLAVFITGKTIKRILMIIEHLVTKEKMPEVQHLLFLMWKPLIEQLEILSKRINGWKSEIETKAKFAALGEMSAQLCHDLKSPLIAIETAVGVSTIEEFDSSKPNLNAAIRRLYAMIDSLKRAETALVVNRLLENIDAESLLLELQLTAKSNNVVINIESEVKFENIWIDKQKIERSITNITLNAIECGAKNLNIRFVKSDATLKIVIENDGPPIPVEIISKIFEKGVTFGKKGGTGNGLSFVSLVAQGHGGEVNHERIGNLTRFSIVLPNAFSPSLESNNTTQIFSNNDKEIQQLEYSPTVFISLENKECSQLLFSMLSDRNIKVVIGLPKEHGKGVVYCDNISFITNTSKFGFSGILASEFEEANEAFDRILKRFCAFKNIRG